MYVGIAFEDGKLMFNYCLHARYVPHFSVNFVHLATPLCFEIDEWYGNSKKNYSFVLYNAPFGWKNRGNRCIWIWDFA